MAKAKKAARAVKVAKAGKVAGVPKATKPVKVATAPQVAKPAQAAKPAQVVKPAQVAKTPQATEAAQAAPAVQSPQTTQTSVPVGIKVIAVLYFIGAVFLVQGGISLINEGSPYAPYAGLGGIIALFQIVLGGIMIPLGVIGLFIGIGLWKARNWARIIAIILAGLGAMSMLFLMLFSFGQANIASYIIASYIIRLLVNLGIGGYLLLSSDVKRAFATPLQGPQTTQTSVPVLVRLSVPVLVRLIAVLYCFGATFFIALFWNVLGGIMIPLGVIGLFTGIGLWNAWNWARIAAIVFAGLGAMSMSFLMLFLFRYANIPGYIIGLLVNLGIGGYLLLSSDVKRAFA